MLNFKKTDADISPTAAVDFTGVKEMRNFASIVNTGGFWVDLVSKRNIYLKSTINILSVDN